MITRRLLYLSCLAGSLVFYLYYQLWVSWVVLLSVAAMPLVSLLLSLPAMLQFRTELEAPSFVTRGQRTHVHLWGLSKLPQPLFRGRIVLLNRNTGEKHRHSVRTPLPTAHCGAWEISAQKVRICDYLGLFSLPVKKIPPVVTVVRPQPVAMAQPPELDRYIARSWRPKFGGGYSENHELRPYRPGDNLNQVHWKLSAKTGTLVLREPMEPALGRILLTMDLKGTPAQIDAHFGHLLWLSRDLLQRGLSHEIRCLTADGTMSGIISHDRDLTALVDRVLLCGIVEEGTLAHCHAGASWQFHIGGDADETR